MSGCSEINFGFRQTITANLTSLEYRYELHCLGRQTNATYNTIIGNGSGL